MNYLKSDAMMKWLIKQYCVCLHGLRKIEEQLRTSDDLELYRNRLVFAYQKYTFIKAIKHYGRVARVRHEQEAARLDFVRDLTDVEIEKLTDSHGTLGEYISYYVHEFDTDDRHEVPTKDFFGPYSIRIAKRIRKKEQQ